VKFLYNKRGRRGDWEKHSFAFFAVGAIVVLAAVFLIGLQVGRVIEKKSAGGDSGKAASSRQPARETATQSADIGKNLGAFSEDAARVPVVPPPDARTAMGDVEKRLTFQDTLPRKEAGPVTLVGPAQKNESAAKPAAAEAKRKFNVQAGAFREKASAETLRKRLAKAGYPARLVKGAGKNREKYYKVMVGPYAEREAARKTMDKLKNEMQVESRLVSG
jgi:cell division protein FtsN